MTIILGCTGHRPHKLGGYDDITTGRLTRFAEEALRRTNPTIVISGMALGWDTAVAQAAINLGLPMSACIPCPQQASRWPAPAQRQWETLIEQASFVKVVSQTYTAACMRDRNIAIVQAVNKLLALWDGQPNGGTFNCIQYARMHRRPVVNLWEDWMRSGQPKSLEAA